MKRSLDQSIVRQINLPSATTRDLYLPDGSRYQPYTDSVDRKTARIVVTGSLSLNRGALSQCRLVETIRDPEDPERFAFLDWSEGQYAVVPQIEHRGKIYVPPSQDAGLVSNLTLPSGVCACGRLNELRLDLRTAIRMFVDMADRDVLLLQSFILASWFPDVFESVPYLWLIGPPGSAKTTLLRLMSCLCRRALLVGDIRAAALYQLVDPLHCTLLIDDFEISGSDSGLLRLLRTGSTCGIPAVRNGRLYSTSGFKVINSRQLPHDTALSSRAVAVSILPCLKELRTLSREEMRRIAEEFQPRLLMFRLTHFSAVRDFQMQSCNLDDMTPRARQLARVLMAPLEGDADAQSDLIALLRERDRETQIERFLEAEWLCAEALFGICHERLQHGGRTSEMLIGGVADHINYTLEYRGEDSRLSARRTGAILKSIGIKSQRLGNLGRGVRLTQAFHRKVHEVARQLGINRSHIATLTGLDQDYGGAPCALCEEFGLTAGLRFVDPTPNHPRARAVKPRTPLFDTRIRDEDPAVRFDDQAKRKSSLNDLDAVD